MSAETWKNVVGFEGWYQVSSHGEVRTLHHVVIRKNGSSYTSRSHMLKPWSVGKYDHQMVALCSPGDKTYKFVHTLVLEAFVGPRPEGMMCRHLDGNPKNNRLDNLCWGTAKENSEDRDRHGTTSRGSKSGVAVLHEQDIPIIRFLLRNHQRRGTMSSIARIYNIAVAAIQAVRDGRSWDLVPEVAWADPTSIHVLCTNCQAVTEQTYRKCEDANYDHYLCSACHHYKFALQDSYQPPLTYGSMSHPKPGKRGESCSASKLKEWQVLEIRQLYSQGGWTYSGLAEKYGVGMMTVRDIIKRKTWFLI